MRRVSLLVILLLLVAGGLWGWKQMFPGAEEQVRRCMADLQESLSLRRSSGNLAQLANLRRLQSLFIEDAWVRVDVPGGPKGVLTGREEIVQATVGAMQAAGDLEVEFLDVVVTVTGDKRAALVEATGKARQLGSSEFWIQELRFQFVRGQDGWQILSVETVRTLTETLPEPVGAGSVPRAG